MDKNSTITVNDNITLITMHNIPFDMGFIYEIFSNIASMGVNIDVISMSPSQKVLTSLSFTVQDDEFSKVLEYTSKLRKKSSNITSIVSSGNCKITICDSRMEDSPGFAAKIFKAVSEVMADIRIITTSIDEIALLITKADCEKTVKRIKSVIY